MTQSGFTEEIIVQVANELSLPENGWKRRRLGRKLRQLETEVPIYQRRKAIKQPAKVRDRLVRLLSVCGKASPTGSESFEKRVQKIILGCEITRALLLWQAALIEDRARPEAAIGDGRAEQVLERILKDPKALFTAATAAHDLVTAKVSSGHGGSRKTSDWALEQAIILLGILFWELTNKRPKISADAFSSHPTGRFLRILQRCLPPLGWDNLTDEAIRHRLRGIRGDALSRLSESLA